MYRSITQQSQLKHDQLKLEFGDEKETIAQQHEATIEMLKAQHEKDIDALRNELTGHFSSQERELGDEKVSIERQHEATIQQIRLDSANQEKESIAAAKQEFETEVSSIPLQRSTNGEVANAKLIQFFFLLYHNRHCDIIARKIPSWNITQMRLQLRAKWFQF